MGKEKVIAEFKAGDEVIYIGTIHPEYRNRMFTIKKISGDNADLVEPHTSSFCPLLTNLIHASKLHKAMK